MHPLNHYTVFWIHINVFLYENLFTFYFILHFIYILFIKIFYRVYLSTMFASFFKKQQQIAIFTVTAYNMLSTIENWHAPANLLYIIYDFILHPYCNMNYLLTL